MRKKLAVLLLSMSILGLGAGCSGKEETDTENTQNTAQETEEESVVNSEGLVVAVDVDNLEDYVTLGPVPEPYGRGRTKGRGNSGRCR